MKKSYIATLGAMAFAATAFSTTAMAANANRSGVTCANLPSYAELKAALQTAADTGAGGSGSTAGFDFPMWATLVDSSGRVCAVAKLDNTDPWPGSRVISAQKANTANAFSTNQVALSTANLYSAVQPGGSLYGLQHSNPVNTLVAYRGDVANFGTSSDPMVGLRVGGVNVFGGGLALYNTDKQVIGAIGLSGDTSCADHEIAWKVRTALVGKGSGSGVVANKVPYGVVAISGVNTDNIVYDISGGASSSGWGQPQCAVTGVVPALSGLTN